MTKILLGVFLGFLVGGPFGALLGGLIGQWFARRWLNKGSNRSAYYFAFNRQRVESAFFRATFLVMGHLAKADGRVSEHEIEMASAIMSEMRLSPERKRSAIELFNQGKLSGLEDIRTTVSEFRRVAGYGSLVPMFLEIQLQAAYADGTLTEAERTVFRRVCDILGVSQVNFERLHKRFLAQRTFYQNGRKTSGSGRQELARAYEVLGVDAASSDSVVKRAYRKLMSQHHPDKLVAKGLPEEMMEVAKQKAQEIQSAYDQIRTYRRKG